ncbi:EAL domain-containing protein [Pseudoalteromonas sp. SIMBA_153]
MKASQSQFTNYASVLFYALCFMLFVIFNSGLNLVLQYQNKQTGIELAEQLQQPLVNKQQLLVNTPFTLAPDKVSVYVKQQKQYFSSNSKGVLLYSWPLWYAYSDLFIIMNVFILVIIFAVRRAILLKTRVNNSMVLKRNQSDGYKKVCYTPKTMPSLSILKTAAKEQKTIGYNIFALIQCECHFDINTDLQATLKVLLAKDFTNTAVISVKLLTAGNFAFTLKGVSAIEKANCAKHLHQCMLNAAYILAPRVADESIKLGVCTYYSNADQVMVYQLARSSLTLSMQSRVKHYHQLALNCSHLKVADENLVKQGIEKQKLAILFQPVYELDSGIIIKHHVLIKSSDKTNKQLFNQDYISQFYNEDEALLLDQAVVMQVKKLLLIEKSSSVISIKLHPKSWFNSEFWGWLSKHMNELKSLHTLQFLINEADFLNNQDRLQTAFSAITALNFNIVIDEVRSSKSIFNFTHNKQIVGLNLAYELVHGIDHNYFQQKSVRGIVHIGKLLSLPVVASSVETYQELQFLKAIGVSTAQGGYFSGLLPDFTQVAFH